jgi:hypothetical protein
MTLSVCKCEHDIKRHRCLPHKTDRDVCLDCDCREFISEDGLLLNDADYQEVYGEDDS